MAILIVAAIWGGLAVFFGGYMMGTRDGYNEAWKDITKVYEEAEKETHRWQ